MSNADRYDDIINLPHHVSTKRKRMAMIDRAAQFSPFAALTGHSSAVNETARLTDSFSEPDEYEKAAIDAKLRFISDISGQKPEISVVYFEPDKRKDGGEYLTVTGTASRVDENLGCLIMSDGRKISVDFIREIKSPLFGDLFSE